ncbi:hypothetical protein MSAR_15870 [Mycolicibacterium sarraceniae]|uniref:Integrase n=1 Tax=Mycolicibacterium sarraceniae TaxID=1534348 RepID=A0A7I7SPX8_9MYCO|nr:hypothetical protein MSAR_15870 [Mycolicibacterium sarraceniae]
MLAISRFLASDALAASSRYTYHRHLRGFYRWSLDNGIGADALAVDRLWG